MQSKQKDARNRTSFYHFYIIFVRFWHNFALDHTFEEAYTRARLQTDFVTNFALSYREKSAVFCWFYRNMTTYIYKTRVLTEFMRRPPRVTPRIFSYR